MPNDCLITTLKSAVNNNAIDKLGYYRIGVNIDSSVIDARRMIRIAHYDVSASNHFIVNVIGGANKISVNNDFSSPTNQINITSQNASGTSIYLLEGTYEIEIFSKYKIKLIVIGSSTSYPNIFSTDLSYLKYGELEQLLLSGQKKVVGDISVFSDMTTLTKLNLSSPSLNEGITGSILSLAKSTGLTELTLSYRSSVVGDVKDLAIAMYNNGAGRTSGTLTIVAQRSGLTYRDAEGKPDFSERSTSTTVISFAAEGYTITDNYA